jgi:hypothetical protein
MKYMALALSILLCMAPLASGEEIILDCIQDAEVDEEEPGVNKGSGVDIMIGGTWGEPEVFRAYGLFEFDGIMTPADNWVEVNQAVVTFYIVGNDNDAEVEFFRAEGNWHESSVDWDSRPDENREVVVIDTAPPMEPPAQIWEADVTEIVRAWYETHGEYHVLYVGVPDNGVVVDIDVASKDHPDTLLHPRLWMDFDVVGVAEDGKNLDNSFTVSQVSPGRVEICLSLASFTSASLKIYDASGSLVETLMDGSIATGFHRLIWNAARPGVYFVRLKTRNKTIVRKTVIIN